MSDSFEAGLRDLYRAAGAHAHGSKLLTPTLVSRTRRRRRVRAIGVSAATVAAVVGVAFVGSAVAGLGAPAPLQPAEPTVTAAPPDPAEPGVYTGPACGTAIGDVPVFDEPPLVIEFTLDDDLLDPAEPLTGRVLLAVPGEFDIDLQPDGMLERLDYAAVQGGLVVGYGRGSLVEGTWQTLSGRRGVTALASIPLRPCDAGSPTLAAGDYQLFASMPVTAADGQDDDLPDSRTILGGPWPFTIDEP